MQKITYTNKEDLVALPDVSVKNKVTAADMNEIKSVVNSQSDAVEELQEDTKVRKVQYGMIVQIPDASNIPDNWLLCDGQALSKVDYAELYKVIGNTYGSTADTFNLPNQNKGAENIASALIPNNYFYIIRAK